MELLMEINVLLICIAHLHFNPSVCVVNAVNFVISVLENKLGNFKLKATLFFFVGSFGRD